MSSIKVLAFSDIHNNVEAVEKLRNLEKNEFDAVIIAGDMGDKNDEPIFEIAASFNCPVLYIYGNWDTKLSYRKKYSENCVHLHQKIISINGYSFAGFSGCKTHWGKNPMAPKIISKLKEQTEIHEKALAKASLKSRKEWDLIEEQFDKKVKKLDKLGINKNTKKYKLKLRRLAEQKNFDLMVSNPHRHIQHYLSSNKYSQYSKALKDAYKEIENLNREKLINTIKNQNCDFSKTFLIAHERLFKTDLDAPNLFAHIFGHVHGFKHTHFKGTNFINVSALDDKLDNEFNPTYCIIKAEDSDIEVICKSISNCKN